MPDLYCKACKKSTSHKVIMKRCKTEPESRFKLLTKLMGNKRVPKMECQHFCRTCNCKSEADPIENPDLVSV